MSDQKIFGSNVGPVQFEIMADDRLRISINPDNADALEELQELYVFGYLWSDILDSCRLLGNDWYEVEPSSVSALTDAPFIGWGKSEDHKGSEVIQKIWFYKDYMVLDPIEEIIEKGEVFFTLA